MVKIQQTAAWQTDPPNLYLIDFALFDFLNTLRASKPNVLQMPKYIMLTSLPLAPKPVISSKKISSWFDKICFPSVHVDWH